MLTSPLGANATSFIARPGRPCVLATSRTVAAVLVSCCPCGGRRSRSRPYHRADMCEQYVACAEKPFRINTLWPFTERLERNGIASYGWGATWLGADGKLHSHRDIGTFAEDVAGREEVGAQTTRAVLVHLRRPSKLSTIGPADTQPFDDPAGRYSFSHNGEFANELRFRKQYKDAGRLHGKADTEVGARWLEDHWNGGTDVPD